MTRMTCGFSSLLHRFAISGRADKFSRLSARMLKRPAHSPPEREAKASSQQSLATSSIESYPVDQSPSPNLNPDPTRTAETMLENTGDNDGRRRIEYLETPLKSETDKKEYRVIKLQNGLTALLIADIHSKTCVSQDESDQEEAISSDETEGDESDEEGEDEDEDEDEDDEESASDGYDEEDGVSATKRIKREEKMAACALCVGVGSFSDPPEIPGMAHFLEHMVFMGSEKYPQENDFDAFITKRGGSDNASTECEQTTFHFDIQEKHFLSALDRFAQFFIKPLMKKDAITREREAVESEFQMALPSDSYRKEQLFCSFARTGHPASKFAWGNLKTLRDNMNDDKLYEELHKFRERHYSAHRMKLAIQARLSLDTLEDYVTKCFTEVPNNELPPDDFNGFKGANSFDTATFRRIYKIKPIKDFCQVELTWVMSPLHDLYKSKPHHYISWIIGHEGKGSLISYLRKKMWCLGTFSGNSESGFEHSSMYALFRLTLVLTDEGHEHLEEVLDAIFSFINLMKKEGPQKRIYDEIEQIEENNFKFTDEERAVEYVEDLCECMHFYPPLHYIAGSELYFEYNPDAIQKCTNYLVPENVNIVIFDKKFNDEEFDKVEPWFQTKYMDTEIPEEWIERWKTIEPLEDFHLPLQNLFLTSDFSLISLPPDVSQYPVKIHDDSISEVWYRPDPKFGLPECFMNFHFISPLVFMSSKNAALMDLYVSVLKLLLVEDVYPAAAAGFNHYIAASEKGVIVSVDGFNEKLALLLIIIVKYMADYPNLIKKELFHIMKEQQIKDYYNTFLKPGKLVKDTRLSILMAVHWTNVEKHAAIRDATFDEFLNFVKVFNDHLYVQCLVQGNIMQDIVIKNVQHCIEILKCGSLLPNTMPQAKVMEIPLGIYYCKLKNFNKTDVNSVVTNYYQAGVASNRLSAIIDLLIMIMEEPLFNQLRTKEQLGYDVCCLYRDIHGILGYSVTVYTQADKYTTDYIDERIEEFLKSFIKILEETTEEGLNSIKEALTKMKQCADIHLKEEVSRNWDEIMTRDYMFDRIEREVLAIKDIKIDELREWVVKHTLNGNNVRKLSLHVVGTASKEHADVENCKGTNEASDVTENHGKIKYSLEYIKDNQQHKKSQDNYITDIGDYKKRLEAYPIKRPAL